VYLVLEVSHTYHWAIDCVMGLTVDKIIAYHFFIMRSNQQVGIGIGSHLPAQPKPLGKPNIVEERHGDRVTKKVSFSIGDLIANPSLTNQH
jgi:hypothetical protein